MEKETRQGQKTEQNTERRPQRRGGMSTATNTDETLLQGKRPVEEITDNLADLMRPSKKARANNNFADKVKENRENASKEKGRS